MYPTTLRIETPDGQDYFYFPIAQSHVSFSVKCGHDARICLRTNLTADSDCYEIAIGERENSLSSIVRNKSELKVVEVEEHDILSNDETIHFRIQWACDGLLTVEHDEETFLSYRDQEPFLINYIGLNTTNGTTGEWTIDDYQLSGSAVRGQLLETRHLWVEYDEEAGMPGDGVQADEDGLYVGRCRHERALLPGSARGSSCVVPWGGQAQEKSWFQVLRAPEAAWARCRAGAVPLHALPAGETEDGAALFVGRVVRDGATLVGKVQPEHQVCYVGWHGREVSHAEYEVLVLDNVASNLEQVGR